MLLHEHVEQHGGDDGQIHGLLRDREPRIDATRGEDVENEPGGEERRGDPALVLAVIELESLEAARGLGYCQARLSTVFSYVAPGGTSPQPSVH